MSYRTTYRRWFTCDVYAKKCYNQIEMPTDEGNVVPVEVAEAHGWQIRPDVAKSGRLRSLCPMHHELRDGS